MKLEDRFRELNPKVKRIFITHDIEKDAKLNEYLFLLYKGIRDSGSLRVERIKFRQLPKLTFSKIHRHETIFHQHWYSLSEKKHIHIFLWNTFWLALFRIVGGKIVWTIHNKYPHEKANGLFNIIFRKIFAKIATSLHVHRNEAMKIMSPILNVRVEKFFIVEHPLYEGSIYGKDIALTNFQSRYGEYYFSELNHEKPIFLMFGQISQYKGIIGVIEIWQAIKPAGATLLIAGQTRGGEGNYSERIQKMTKADSTIIFINKAIPQKDVSLLLNICDTVIFNYKDVLTSGGVILAQSYNKNIIAPDEGCIKDLNYNRKLMFTGENELKAILIRMTNP